MDLNDLQYLRDLTARRLGQAGPVLRHGWPAWLALLGLVLGYIYLAIVGWKVLHG